MAKQKWVACWGKKEASGDQHERDTSTKECERSLRLNNNGQKRYGIKVARINIYKRNI